MTLPFSPSRAVYQGNGAATAFPFAFKVWSTDQLSVSITSPQGRTTTAQGWTASLGENGGTLTYLHNGAPLPDGWRLAIVRDMPFAQGIDLVSASRFDPKVIEDGLDQATAELQQLNEKITRAVIMPPTSEQSPEDVVLSIYASRHAAAASASDASVQAAAADASAQAAASSADDAASSATAAALAAAEAEAASGGMAPRMDAVESTNTQQDTRLTAVESGVTAISTTLIGSVFAHTASDTYVPNGCVPANGGEYTRAQFPTFFDDYLVGGKLLTCTYSAFAAQVAITGNCTKFALDKDAQKFRVPLYKDGDSITHAASAAELGKSYKAGLPDVTGDLPWWAGHDPNTPTINGIFKLSTVQKANMLNLQGTALTTEYVKAALSYGNPIYGNSSTVTDEQVRLRHFVVVASAQNSASVFEWSAYMTALAGKANVDLSNATGNAINQYLHVCDEKPSGVNGGSTTAGAWQTRGLNAVRVNRINATLANNKITLPAGRYYIRATMPAYAVNRAKAALYNSTGAAYLLYSSSNYADSSTNVHALMPLEGEFTLTDTTALELRMWAQSANALGMGVATSISGVPEVYSEVHIWKM